MWRISLLDEVVSNIITAYSDGAMLPELGSMPITEGFSNNIYECETMGQIIQFYHATLGYPCTSTWCKFITAGYFIGWPGLTTVHVRPPLHQGSRRNRDGPHGSTAARYPFSQARPHRSGYNGRVTTVAQQRLHPPCLHDNQ